MNAVDKVISVLSPEWALKRTLARKRIEMSDTLFIGGAGYGSHGASYGKKSLIGWSVSGQNADDDIVANLATLRDRSRDLYMGGGFATGAIKTIRTNVVGSGIMLSALPDEKFLKLTEDEAREWRQNVEREWKLFSNDVNCDAERKLNFYQIQSLVLMSALMSGDVFVYMPIIKRAGVTYDLCVGLIEADRVCNPSPYPVGKNVWGGVELGEYGETVAYYVAKYHPGATLPLNAKSPVQSWKRVLAFGRTTGRKNVLHIMCDVERPAQRRGVPLLAPVIEALKQLSRYTEAELMAAVISGMFTVFVKSSTPSNPMASMFPPQMKVDKKDPIAYEMGNGAIVSLDPNEEIQTANPGRPNTAFEGFVQAICRQIGSALELPYELLIKHFTASYSAARASLLEAWKMFRMRREWLASSLCQPVYEEWLTEAVLKGRVKAPGFFDDPAIRAAWCNADWYGDSMGQLNPLDEAKAAEERVKSGFSTREREASEITGMKFDEIHAARTREEKMRREAGLVTDSQGQIVTNPNPQGEQNDQ